MSEQKQKKNNHLYPRFHIKKWLDSGGRIYNKNTKKIRYCRAEKDYTSRYYYSLGEGNSKLEDKISKFESYIAPIISRIDESEFEVKLTGKELELLKLYCVLCGSRHEYTSEVIKEDESGIYQSNNYLWGLHRAKTQKEAVAITEMIIQDFERIYNLNDDIESQASSQIIFPEYMYSAFTTGLHIAIGRAESPMLCISDRFCIIENTIDSDFLYSYVPISPRTALFLVKSKYYIDREAFENTKIRFGNKYGGGIPDPYLSIILGIYKNYDVEDKLFCSYYNDSSQANTEGTYVGINLVKEANVKINTLPKFVFKQFNSIFCEDGTKILFCDEQEMRFALNNRLCCRTVSLM